MPTFSKNFYPALVLGAYAVGLLPARAQNANPVVVAATDLLRSQEVYARGDYVIIYGKEGVKTYIYYQLSQLPFTKFQLQVEAAGESGDGRWPNLGIALNDTGKIIKEIEIKRANFQTYDLGHFEASASTTLYLVFTNDYYNATTRADVNLKLRQVVFTPAASAAPSPVRIDTFVVKGATATLEWNPNPEADLVGYRVFKGLESGKYLTPIAVGKATSYEFDLDPRYKYYFAVAAVDASNNQSPLSQEVLALVETDSSGSSLADLNGDGKCDMADQTILQQAMGSTCNGRRYDRKADLNQDCKVDGLDLILFSANCQ